MSNSLTITDEKLTKATVDSATGFLEIPLTNFTAKEKLTFLRIFEQTGDRTVGLSCLGYSNYLLNQHLRVDKVFKQAYEDTIDKMATKLESTMYQNALQPKGTLDRFGWLRANKPDKYNPKQVIEHKGDNSNKLNELFNKAIDIQVIKEKE